jgi:hypothetical protein
VDISEHQFYTWRRRYRSVHPELSASKAESSEGEKQFHEVKFDHFPSAVFPGGLEIHYPHGVRVVIPMGNGLDMKTLFSFITDFHVDLLTLNNWSVILIQCRLVKEIRLSC